MCIGRQPRALRPGTRPPLETCRTRVDYVLTRCPCVRRLKLSELIHDNSNARTEVNALNRSARVPAPTCRTVAAKSALLTRLPANTHELLVDLPEISCASTGAIP